MKTPGSLKAVVVLNDYCYVNGGASRIAIDEAVALAERGLRVIFLGAVGPICEELSASNVHVICLDQAELLGAPRNPSVIVNAMWNLTARARMEHLLGDLHPYETIVHLHGYTKALSVSPVHAATRQGFRVLCTLHDFFSACPNGALFDYVENRACDRRGLSRECIRASCDKRHYGHKLYRVVRTAVQRYSGALPGAVMDYITLSSRSAELLRPYLPERARYHPLENLIEVTRRPPVAVADNKELVAVGRLDIEKGIRELLEAVRRTNAKLTLVGDGPLRAEAEATPGVRVTGWVSASEVMKELEIARCLVFPSLWYETYGLVVSEAAARGLPSIVSDISAASERVRHGIDGWHVTAGSVDSLSAAISTVADDALVRDAGIAAYERFWSSPPTRQNHIMGLVGIYEGVLQGARANVQLDGEANS